MRTLVVLGCFVCLVRLRRCLAASRTVIDVLLSVIHPPRSCGSEARDPFARLLIWYKPIMLAAADRLSPSGARFEALVSGANGDEKPSGGLSESRQAHMSLRAGGCLATSCLGTK